MKSAPCFTPKYCIYCLHKDRIGVKAYDIRLVCLFSSVFFGNDVLQLFLVPAVHGVLLLLLLLLAGVDVPLGSSSLNARVVRELALVTLLAEPLLEERAKHGLGIGAWGKKGRFIGHKGSHIAVVTLVVPLLAQRSQRNPNQILNDQLHCK